MFLGGVVADEFAPLDTLVFACKEADYGPDEHTIGHAILVLFSLAKVSVVLSMIKTVSINNLSITRQCFLFCD